MEKNRPEWIPNNAGNEYTSNVMKGISYDEDRAIVKKKIVKPKKFSVDDYVNGILSSDLVSLSKAITLIESNSNRHSQIAQEVLKNILPKTGNSIRIGISGPPGVGKSTFIEALGMFLTENNIKTAVLAVDPSSTVTRGSILGDKTRMELLSREKNAFIRPSPSAGTLGGVAKKTRETILLCEAAGYEVILIETIGVGQSEITVRSMVDLFMLLLQPGSGDELQGIKKGVVEIADILVVNKADGDNKNIATATQREYKSALKLLSRATEGWDTKVETCSAAKNIGIEQLWTIINEFILNTQNSGVFHKRRKQQILDWFTYMLQEKILDHYFNNTNFKSEVLRLQHEITDDKITPGKAVEVIYEKYVK